MQFLRENKRILFIFLVLPIFFLYLDKKVMMLLKEFRAVCPQVHSLLVRLDPLVYLLYNSLFLLAAIFIALGIVNKYRRGDGYIDEFLRSLLYGIAISGISIQIKHLFGRTRPKLGYDTVFVGPSLKYAYSSFPSGHTTFVFMVSSILSRFYPKYRFLFYGLALWIGFERIEDNAHFPSDVIAGAILGFLIGRFVLYRFGKINFTDYAEKQ